MRNLGIKVFFLIWRKSTLNVDLGGGGKHIYIYIYIYIRIVMCILGGLIEGDMWRYRVMQGYRGAG